MQVKLTKRQTEAWDILTNDQNADVLYGGAKGGGKSYFLCVWAFYWCNWLIDFFDIKEPLKFPLPVGFMGRLQGVDFRTTTLETWKKTIPADMYEIRAQDKEIVIRGRVKIMFGGLDKGETVAKFNSAELAFFILDQAEEVDQEDIAVLEGSLRLTYNGKTPPYKTLYTANPRAGWLKRDFVAKGRPDSHFIKALPRDNPYLPKNYEDQLRKAFGHNEALLKAYLEGDWDAFVGAFFETFQQKHVVYDQSSVVIQPTWPRYRSADWGFSAPMAVYWHAVAPDNHVYTYREWYKTGVLDVDASKEIAAITENAKEKIEYTVGDPQSFPVTIAHYKFGKTMSVKRADIWAENGVPMIMGDSSRVAGWAQMLQYLQVREYASGPSPHWHISRECPNLIEELISAQRSKTNVEDISDKSSDHGLESCFVAGTKVMTDCGMVNIESIKAGDKILTREGFKDVVASQSMGVKTVYEISFSNGEKLIGTADHPIFCNNEWTRLDSCSIGDICKTIQTITEKQGSCGANISVKFRKGITSTIKTTTLEIMILIISIASWLANIFQTMSQKITGFIPKNIKNIWPELDRLPLLQNKLLNIDRKEVISRKENGPKNNRESCNASSVAASSSQEVSTQNSATATANNDLPQKSTWLNRIALFVKQCLKSLNFLQQKPVLKNVRVISEAKIIGEKEVFNLEVKDCHEYFANSILVHNCRLFLMTQKPIVKELIPLDGLPLKPTWQTHEDFLKAYPKAQGRRIY